MSMYEATVEGEFRASHSVPRPDGSMEPSHEHPWRVAAVFRSEELDAGGFVIDFLAVKAALAKLSDSLAGADLNVALGRSEGGASAERVAEHIAGALRGMVGVRPHCVRVAEAPGCTAAFYPDQRSA